jgi:hypothetical protein
MPLSSKVKENIGLKASWVTSDLLSEICVIAKTASDFNYQATSKTLPQLLVPPIHYAPSAVGACSIAPRYQSFANRGRE